jgi:hypothetical protein
MNNVFDLDNQIDTPIGFDLLAIGTNTTTPGEIIDTKTFVSLEFLILSSALVSGDGIFTIILEHGDDSGLSDAAAVPVAEVLGAAVFTGSDPNTAKRVGYIGKKRYVRLSIVSTNITTGFAQFTAAAMLGKPYHQPVVD